jgi:hypothetical protein
LACCLLPFTQVRRSEKRHASMTHQIITENPQMSNRDPIKTHYRVHRDGMWRSISAFSCHFCDFTVELQTSLSFVTLFFLVPIFRLFAMRDEIMRHMRTKHPDRFYA